MKLKNTIAPENIAPDECIQSSEVFSFRKIGQRGHRIKAWFVLNPRATRHL